MKDTIKSSREIDAMFRTAKREGDALIVVFAAEGDERRGPQGRVAVIAGKKIGSAVRRNRAKRLLRAAAHEAGGPWRGWDVLLLATPHTNNATSSEISTSLARHLSALGVRGR